MSTLEHWDWLVIGNGIAGAAIAYELARLGARVVVVEAGYPNATQYSYGGLNIWAGQTAWQRQLTAEGWALHQTLPLELDAPTGWRELTLLLTVAAADDPTDLVAQYAACAHPPRWVDRAQASELEPLLNPAAIAGAFVTPHGQVHPSTLVQAYNQGLQRQGGTVRQGTVVGLQHTGDRVTGVQLATGETLVSQGVVVAAGGWSRALLAAVGLALPLFFSHAELIQTPPLALTLATMVIPARSQRVAVESQRSPLDLERQWQEWQDTTMDVLPPLLDAGAVQLSDRSLRLGQISRYRAQVLPPALAAADSEAQLRQAIGTLLPALQDCPGTWARSPVAFSVDGLPVVGACPGRSQLYLFNSFNSPLVMLPAIARRFAAVLHGEPDPLVATMTPSRLLATTPT